MRLEWQKLPVAFDLPEIKCRFEDLGDMSVEVSEVAKTFDPAPMFKGLRDDRCQCPHWGYVIRGNVRFRFADREEVYKAGELYYVEPGHTPVFEAGALFLEYSPKDKIKETLKVVERNMVAQKLAKAA